MIDLKKHFPLFIKIDRLAAWTLLLVILLYAISGFGMTKGIINPQLAYDLHLYWLAVIGLIAFMIHTGWAIHLSLKRRKLWSRFAFWAMLAIYLLIAGFFVYFAVFYQSPVTAVSANQSAVNNANSVGNNATSAALPIFNAQSLKKYNGQNGQPAYVAIDGKVYDLSSIFVNGIHYGFFAGQDLSRAFQSQHVTSILSKFTIVGIYK